MTEVLHPWQEKAIVLPLATVLGILKTSVTLMNFQTINIKRPDRTDHVWFKLKSSENYKCCICGAITRTPPNFPTPKEWMPPLEYEKLTAEERELAPPIPK